MPKKKKPEIVEVEEPIENDEELTEAVKTEVYGTVPKKAEVEAKKPTDMVKVKVLVGTLKWEGGTFEKGEVFECSRQRALSFGNSVEILK